MRAVYRTIIYSPEGYFERENQILDASKRFWEKQKVLAEKEHVKLKYYLRNINGVPLVVTVLAEYKDGTRVRLELDKSTIK